MAILLKYKWSYYLSIFIILIVEVSSNKTTKNLEEVWKTKDWGSLPEDPTDITSIMFHKFADNGKGLTLSGLENLVKCSTGSSECLYPSKIENGESPFQYLTDCNINSALSPAKCEALNTCLRGGNFLSLLPSFNTSIDVITEDELRALLPAILYQVQSQFCQGVESESEAVRSSKPTTLEVWGYAFLFVTLISVCSLAGVSVMPLMARNFYQKLLTLLIGLAVGSLAASAVFHLIPQAYGITSADGHHDYLFLSLAILFGVWLFFMIERVLKVVFMTHKFYSQKLPNAISKQTIVSKQNGAVEGVSYKGRENFECSSSCADIVACDENKCGSQDSINIECGDGNVDSNPKPTSVYNSKELQLIYASQEQAIKASFGHEQKPHKTHEQHEVNFHQGDSVIATVAWMIIFGDGFHNFIDGVSIGAAFQKSTLTGISISLAVMCEELPHELGDFAVLLNSGMSVKQALFYNFLSATTCYLGMIIGILLGEFTEDSTYIFALAAGMFLYISFVDMVPEMNETAEKAAEMSVSDVIYVLFLQNVGLFLGVFSLFFLAYYQDNITLG